MLTVRELVADLGLQICAGDGGLDLPIRWVHMSELLDPTPWLSGGEVLLSTGMMLGTPARQRQFVKLLADHRLAALGFGVGFGHDRVPSALIEAARELDFPVFEVPFELPFIAITESAFTRLVNEQYEVLRRALAAHERLERIVLAEGGLGPLTGALATQLAASVLVFDRRAELLARHRFRRELAPGAFEQLQSAVRDRSSLDDDRTLVLPVSADGARSEPEAWLVAIKDDAPLSDFDRLMLRQAVTIVALELLRHRVVGDTERRLGADALAAVLRGELAGADLQRRLAPFGLGDGVAALVLRPRGAPAAVVESALIEALRGEGAVGLVAADGGLVCALIPGHQEEALFALAERTAGRLATELAGEPIELGVGRATATGDARRALHEGRCALEAISLGVAPSSKNGNGHGRPAADTGPLASISAQPRVATYRDLGSFQLLLTLQDGDALQLYCDSVLGAIESSEGPYAAELMRSLEAFIEENGQWERAARRLFCHRHTLRYRIRRVEELTGRDLGSARDRIEFWLALRGRELV